MSYPVLKTPHGPLVAVHNGATLAYLTRQRLVVEAARRLAEERGLLVDAPTFEPRTEAEQELAEALLKLGVLP